MSLMGNLSAWGAPLVGMGGWKRYEENAYTGARLEIPKAPEYVQADEHTLDYVPITARYAAKAMKDAQMASGNGHGTPSEAQEMAGAH
jgi:hypothetical protein